MERLNYHRSGITGVGLAFLFTCGVAAIPAQAQVRRAQSTVLRSPMDRAYLGVGIIELTDDRVKALGLKNDDGVEVKRVDPASPAEKAGLKENDVILEVNGKTVEDIAGFVHTIAALQPGAKLNLAVWREGMKKKLMATLEARAANVFPDFPDTSSMPPIPSMPDNPLQGLGGSPPLIGFEGETLSPQLAEFFGVKEGVLIRTVGAKSPAEKAGLKAGDVIVKVNGTPVTSVREISGLAHMSRKKVLAITIVRNKKEMTLDVEIAEASSPFFPGFGSRDVL